MANGIKKNLEVVKAELEEYGDTLQVEWDRLKREPWKRKGHVLFGLIPDAHRDMPRTLSYLAVLSIIPAAVAVWWYL
jgi:hypothetical protein